MMGIMIKKMFIGASFVFKRLNNINIHFINLRNLNLCSQYSYAKDARKKNYWNSENHKIIMEMERLIEKERVPLKLCANLLREAVQLQRNTFFFYISDLHNSSGFNRFCSRLCDRKIYYTYKIAIDILMSMSMLRLAKSNPLHIINLWEATIDNNMWFLTLEEIYSLHLSLRDMPKSNWLKMRKTSLIQQFKILLSNTNIDQFSNELRQIIIKMIEEYKIDYYYSARIFLDNELNRQPIDWFEVFVTLSLMKEDQHFHSVLKECYNHMKLNIMNYNINQMRKLITIIYYKMAVERIPEFYNAEFVDSIIDHIIYYDYNFQFGLNILQTLSSLKHKHELFLNCMLHRVENVKSINNCARRKLMLMLFKYAVKTNCDLTANVILKKLLKEKKCIIFFTKEKELIHFIYSMALFDYYDEDLIRAIEFKNYYEDWQKLNYIMAAVKYVSPFPQLYDYLNEKKMKNTKKLNVVINLKNDGTNFENSENNLKNNFQHNEMIHNKKIIVENNKQFFANRRSVELNEKWRKREKQLLLSLKSKMELLFGGPQYLISNPKVFLHLYADYFVILRQGGYPVAFNSELLYKDHVSLKTIPVPSSCHPVTLHILPSHAFISNTGEISRSFQGTIKLLRAVNKNTVFIYENNFKNVPEHKKLSWLMEQIKEQCHHIYQQS